jgi:hypothetical protein
MREESHLDDMRTAIRGDFERLAERRGEQELLTVPPDEPQPATEAETDADEAEREAGSAAPEVGAAEPESDTDVGEVDREAEEPPRSWVARLLRR